MKSYLSGECFIVMKICIFVFALLLFLRPLSADDVSFDDLTRQLRETKEKGQYKEALDIAEKVLNKAKDLYGPDHPYLKAYLDDMAELHTIQKDYATAEQMYWKVFSIMETNYSSQNPAMATVMNKLGKMNQYQGKFAEAENCYQKALKICQKSFGNDQPKIAISVETLKKILSNMVSFYEETEKPVLAEKYKKHLMQIKAE